MKAETDSRPRSVVAFATKGTGTNDENRLRTLLANHDPLFLPYQKAAKKKSFLQLIRWLAANRADLVVMEGTGIAGGLPCIAARLFKGQHYVVSSGDTVGPLIGAVIPALGPFFGLYERILCRLSSGYIGWTPYLVGRAMTFGTPRAMTAAGWSEASPSHDARRRIRNQLQIPENAIVFGIVGSLVWAKRFHYCYGYELVAAALKACRSDMYVLIVGDGEGLLHLKSLAAQGKGVNVVFTGNVPSDQVVDYMAAMDVGSLPQSVDGVGSFRYTTKLSEYLAAGLPVVTSQIPLSYDLDEGWLWRLPGDAPWDQRYLNALSQLMRTLRIDDLAARRNLIPSNPPEFDRDRQVAAATRFISDVLEQLARRPSAKPIAAIADQSVDALCKH